MSIECIESLDIAVLLSGSRFFDIAGCNGEVVGRRKKCFTGDPGLKWRIDDDVGCHRRGSSRDSASPRCYSIDRDRSGGGKRGGFFESFRVLFLLCRCLIG